MKKLKFEVEKNQDGFWAHTVDKDAVIGAYGQTLAELKEDAVRAYNFLLDDPKKQITEDDILFKFNISSFFELYGGLITSSGIGKRAGMQKSVISEYINGKRKPSQKQIEKIALAVNELAKELSELEIA